MHLQKTPFCAILAFGNIRKGDFFMNGTQKGMLAAFVAYFIFGLSYLFSKMALDVTEPLILLGSRFTVTLIALNLLVAFRVMKLDLKGKPVLGPILLGILQPVLYFVLENYGLKYTTTAFTGMVSSVSPIFTVILGAVMLRERPNLRQWICIGVSIVGVLLVSIGSTGGKNTLPGCLCLLGAYFSGSFYSILVRKLSKKFSAFELTYIMFTVGFVFFAALAFINYRGETVSMLTHAFSQPTFITSVFYLGVAASVVAYMLVNYSLARLPVSRSTVFSAMSTLVSILAGVVVMGDPVGPSSIIAIILILTGVWGVNYFAAPPAE